jgi:hypothetical protein
MVDFLAILPVFMRCARKGSEYGRDRKHLWKRVQRDAGDRHSRGGRDSDLHGPRHKLLGRFASEFSRDVLAGCGGRHDLWHRVRARASEEVEVPLLLCNDHRSDCLLLGGLWTLCRRDWEVDFTDGSLWRQAPVLSGRCTLWKIVHVLIRVRLAVYGRRLHLLWNRFRSCGTAEG